LWLVDNNNVCSGRQSQGTHKAKHGLHGSPGDAKHRPETRGVAALLTMRISDLILNIRTCLVVMAGLDPAIHVFLGCVEAGTWMPGSSPAMTTS
jgi:hypothetical protein